MFRSIYDYFFKEYQLYDFYAVHTPTQPPVRFTSLRKANKYIDNYIAQNPQYGRYVEMHGYNQKDLDEFTK